MDIRLTLGQSNFVHNFDQNLAIQYFGVFLSFSDNWLLDANIIIPLDWSIFDLGYSSPLFSLF